MKKTATIILLAVMQLAFSCVYPYDTQLEGEDMDIVVLEGDIVIGGNSSVRISKVNTFSDENSYGEIKAVGSAWVEDDQGTIYKPSSGDNTGYMVIPTENAVPGRKHRIKAQVEGKTYVSDWIESLTPPGIEDISFSLSKDSTMVEVRATLLPGSEGTGYIGLSFEETWEFHTAYECKYELDTLSWEVSERRSPYPNYWCWRSNNSAGLTLLDYTEIGIDKVEEFLVQSFLRTNERNHRRYSVKVNAVTLPAATYRYLKNLEDITNGSGSLFSPNPGEMSSNIACESDPDRRVMGYVVSSLQTSSRAFLDSRYYSPTTPYTGYLYIPERTMATPPDMELFEFEYSLGSYPVDFMSLPRGENGQDVEGVYWGPFRCVDCIADGGTKQKPDFWDQ